MVRSNTASKPATSKPATASPHDVLAALTDIERQSPDQFTRKRQFDRYSLRGEAILQPIHAATVDVKMLRVQLRNISRTGVGFLATEPIPTGTLWRVTFVIRNYAMGQQTVTIRHSRPIADGVFLTGGQFCIEPGLLHIMGIDPDTLSPCDTDEFLEMEDFLAPGEVE